MEIVTKSMEQENCYWSPSAICTVGIGSKPNEVFVIGSNADDRREFIDIIMNTLRTFGLEPRFAIDLKENNGYQAFCRNICTEIRSCGFVIIDLSGAELLKSEACICNDCASEDCQVKYDYQFSVNVFWEYGFAAALKKRTILLCDDLQYLPFDVADKEVEFYDKENLEEKLKILIKNELEGRNEIELPLTRDISNDLDKIDKILGNKLEKSGLSTDLDVWITASPVNQTNEVFYPSQYRELKSYLTFKLNRGPIVDSISRISLFGVLKNLREGIIHIDNNLMGGSIIISRMGNIIYSWHYKKFESAKKRFPCYYLSAYLFTFLAFLKEFYHKVGYSGAINLNLSIMKIKGWEYSDFPDFLEVDDLCIFEDNDFDPLILNFTTENLENIDFIISKVEDIISEILLGCGYDGIFTIRKELKDQMQNWFL